MKKGWGEREEGEEEREWERGDREVSSDEIGRAERGEERKGLRWGERRNEREEMERCLQKL